MQNIAISVVHNMGLKTYEMERNLELDTANTSVEVNLYARSEDDKKEFLDEPMAAQCQSYRRTTFVICQLSGYNSAPWVSDHF